MMVPQLKIAPLFRAVSSTFSEISPLFRVVSSTFSEILTPILHENRYNLARKRTPFILLSTYTFADTPLFQPNQEQTKTHIFEYTFKKYFHSFFQISSTRSWKIFTPFFSNFEYTPRKSTPFYKFCVHFMLANIVLKRPLFSAKF